MPENNVSANERLPAGAVSWISGSVKQDIAIVGAGAAGLTAAIFARRESPAASIVLIDGAPKIGAKILISGGGRCNVTNHVVRPDDFNGNRNAIARVLRSFTVEQTVAWFADLGVPLKREETGKLFPVGDRARAVVDALLRACEGVEIRTASRVTAIEAVGDGFSLSTSGDALSAWRVILATGGRSVPKTGSDGSGYALARALGHGVTEVYPALVPLLLEEGHWLRELSGTSHDVELSVRSPSGRVRSRHRGAMLLTHFGLSGPVVLDVSRHLTAARREEAEATLVANLLPDESFESLDVLLLEEARRNPRATVPSILRGRLPERLLTAVAPASAISSFSREQRRRVVRDLIELVLPVVRDRGFDFAEVTAGGVPLAEVELATMQSRRTPGVFLCGEILDVDGRIGGFNFQWAWASGRLAGMGAARSLKAGGCPAG